MAQNDDDDILTPSDLGKKLVVALHGGSWADGYIQQFATYNSRLPSPILQSDTRLITRLY